MKINIRKATKNDIVHVYDLIQELAEYEKAPGEVSLTLNELQNDGFGDNPSYYCLVAETEEQIIGMALYYIKYSTWKGKCIFLEDIIVKEIYRRQKIGKQLFEEVLSIAKKWKVARVEWQVLDWNTPAIKFYEKYHAQFLKEWISCRLSDDQIKGFH